MLGFIWILHLKVYLHNYISNAHLFTSFECIAFELFIYSKMSLSNK